MKNTKPALSTNQTMPGTQVNGTTGNGGSQPPRNKIVNIAHMVQIATYSPRMNIMGNSGNQYQPNRPQREFCASTIVVRLSEPTQSSTVMMTKPIETSYETICAAERSAARKGYFEFDAQPAMITPYTPSDEIAKI